MPEFSPSWKFCPAQTSILFTMDTADVPKIQTWRTHTHFSKSIENIYIFSYNHTALNQIHNLIYVAKKIFSRYMDNVVCLYSLVQCPKAIDQQNPQSRFLRIEKSTSSNWGPGLSNSISTYKFQYIYTHALHEVVPCHSQCYLMPIILHFYNKKTSSWSS